jgi:amidase
LETAIAGSGVILESGGPMGDDFGARAKGGALFRGNGAMPGHGIGKYGAGLALVGLLAASPVQAQELAFGSAAEQQAAVASGKTTFEAITRSYLKRIAALDRKGPRLNTIIALNPAAASESRAFDRQKPSGSLPLRGLTILVKDNIETRELPTTAGSLALKDNDTHRDAPLAAKLRAAGAVILGKTNLSEWANFRSTHSISGWSAIGGLVRNPYALDRSACGSSAGSAAAVAAGLAWAAIGTETDGSITCPSSMNGVVGLKPTVGLISRSRVVPISVSQDTAGPITRSVTDAALLLTVMAGSDPADAATADADAHKTDYVAALAGATLKGVRIGVLRYTRSPQTDAAFEQALKELTAQGAILVDVPIPDEAPLDKVEQVVMHSEFKAGINAYLADAAPAVKARTLSDLIAFDDASPREMALFGQEIFLDSAKAPDLSDPAYVNARDTERRLAGPEGIDRMLKEANVAVLVATTNGPASVVDPVNGSRWLGSPSTWPAAAGYPHLTVPMGRVSGLPVGLSFIGPKWSEAELLRLGYAFEQATKIWTPPRFPASVSEQPEFARAFAPE